MNRTTDHLSRAASYRNASDPPSTPIPPRSTTPTGEEDSETIVVLHDLDNALPELTARLRGRVRVRNVERAIRRFLGPAILESDTVRVYNKRNEAFRSDDRLQINPQHPQPLNYRVFPSESAEPPSGSTQVAFTPTATESVGEIPRSLFRVPHEDIAGGMTVAQLRDIYASTIGILDPNTVMVYLRGGPRSGALEGNGWEVRKLMASPHQAILMVTCHQTSYIVVRGYGNEYLYQASLDTGNGMRVKDLQRWLTERVLRSVHSKSNNRASFTPADISLYIDGNAPASDNVLVPWTTEVEFRLPSNAEAIFSAEQEKLCSFFDCSVCGEKSYGAERVTAGCTHPPTVCKSCTRQWVSTCLSVDGWDKARCPLCSNPLAYEEIKTHASRRDFERYEMLATKAAVGSIPNFYWCLEKDCGSGQIHEPNRRNTTCPDSLFVCHACDGRHCTKHAVKWHEGLTCDEYEMGRPRKLKDEKASEVAIRGISKQCPRCARMVSKYVGCNHITCICGHQWCYLCLAAWTHCERTNIPYCDHLAECPERFDNPFFGERDANWIRDFEVGRPVPRRTDNQPVGRRWNRDHQQGDDRWDPDRWEPDPQWQPEPRPVVRPHVHAPPPNFPRRGRHLPGHHPPSPAPPNPAVHGVRHRLSRTPNPAHIFPQTFNHRGFLNDRVNPYPLPVPEPIIPQHGLRPYYLLPPQPNFPGPPTPGPDSLPFDHGRVPAERMLREYSFGQRADSVEHEPPMMNPHYSEVSQIPLPLQQVWRPRVRVPPPTPRQLGRRGGLGTQGGWSPM